MFRNEALCVKFHFQSVNEAWVRAEVAICQMLPNTFTFTTVYKILSLLQMNTKYFCFHKSMYRLLYFHNCIQFFFSLSQIYKRYFRFHNITQNIFTLTIIYEPCWLYTNKIDAQYSQAKSMRPRAFWPGVLSRKGGYELWIASLNLPSSSGWVIRSSLVRRGGSQDQTGTCVKSESDQISQIKLKAWPTISRAAEGFICCFEPLLSMIYWNQEDIFKCILSLVV